MTTEDSRPFFYQDQKIAATVVSGMVYCEDKVKEFRNKVLVSTQGGRKANSARIKNGNGRLWSLRMADGYEFPYDLANAIFAVPGDESNLSSCTGLELHKKCLVKDGMGITFKLTKSKDNKCAMPYRSHEGARWHILYMLRSVDAQHWFISKESFLIENDPAEFLEGAFAKKPAPATNTDSKAAVKKQPFSAASTCDDQALVPSLRLDAKMVQKQHQQRVMGSSSLFGSSPAHSLSQQQHQSHQSSLAAQNAAPTDFFRCGMFVRHAADECATGPIGQITRLDHGGFALVQWDDQQSVHAFADIVPAVAGMSQQPQQPQHALQTPPFAFSSQQHHQLQQAPFFQTPAFQGQQHVAGDFHEDAMVAAKMEEEDVESEDFSLDETMMFTSSGDNDMPQPLNINGFSHHNAFNQQFVGNDAFLNAPPMDLQPTLSEELADTDLFMGTGYGQLMGSFDTSAMASSPPFGGLFSTNSDAQLQQQQYQHQHQYQQPHANDLLANYDSNVYENDGTHHTQHYNHQQYFDAYDDIVEHDISMS